MARGVDVIKLPLFLHDRNKIAAAFFFGTLSAVMYMFSNRIHFFDLQMLPMTRFDKAIPFIPETVWIYTSEYFLFISAYFLSSNNQNANKYLYAFIGLQTISVTIFMLWPTTFPRELFPLPDNLDPFTYALFNHLRNTDTPANCCPSLHVSSCYMASFIFIEEQRRKFLFFFLWATAVGFTTLTTKQHYIIDIVAALPLSILTYLLFYKWVKYYEYKPAHQATR